MLDLGLRSRPLDSGPSALYKTYQKVDTLQGHLPHPTEEQGSLSHQKWKKSREERALAQELKRWVLLVPESCATCTRCLTFRGHHRASSGPTGLLAKGSETRSTFVSLVSALLGKISLKKEF